MGIQALEAQIVEQLPKLTVVNGDKPKRRSRTQVFYRGKMTWKLLENVLRHYEAFRELFEQTGVDELRLDNGYVVNILDLLQGINELPLRQKQAVWLMVVLDYREVDAAKIMGSEKWSSHVGLYKRLALQKLIDRYWPPEEEVE